MKPYDFPSFVIHMDDFVSIVRTKCPDQWRDLCMQSIPSELSHSGPSHWTTSMGEWTTAVH